MSNEASIRAAAEAIESAEFLMISAGAGMGVDSGLPDFRGNEGFWNAYPPFKQRGLTFYDMANPRWFSQDPHQAWGFYGHRTNLYAQTEPHAGFKILQRWATACTGGYFVFTSNVDGHFQTSGFDPKRIVECHGSIELLQCSQPCQHQIWQGTDKVAIDDESFRAVDPLPECPSCQQIARPNILMFGDMSWISDHVREQDSTYANWLRNIGYQARLVVIEIGAGTAVPTVRRESEQRIREFNNARLIRINPREPQSPSNQISIASGALDALTKIDELVE
ncbi:MAG: Sir2 family NAD-dependent protein deacetylase [Planctomycetota bacterium]